MALLFFDKIRDLITWKDFHWIFIAYSAALLVGQYFQDIFNFWFCSKKVLASD